MRIERDYCWECGHKETWREAIRSWWLRRGAPVGKWEGSDIVSDIILDEVRPTSVTRPLFRHTSNTGVKFTWTGEDTDG